MALTDETARNPARSKPPRSGLARSSLSVVAGVLLALILTEALLRFGLGLGNPILIQADSACAFSNPIRMWFGSLRERAPITSECARMSCSRSAVQILFA